MLLIIFEHLDLQSISRLESSCCQLRDMVVQTSIYRRRWKEVKQITEEGSADKGRLTEVQEEGQSKIQRSLHFKGKLSEYYLRHGKLQNF